VQDNDIVLELLVSVSFLLVIVLYPSSSVLRLKVNLTKLMTKAGSKGSKGYRKVGHLAKIRTGEVAFEYLVGYEGFNDSEAHTCTLADLVFATYAEKRRCRRQRSQS